MSVKKDLLEVARAAFVRAAALAMTNEMAESDAAGDFIRKNQARGIEAYVRAVSENKCTDRMEIEAGHAQGCTDRPHVSGYEPIPEVPEGFRLVETVPITAKVPIPTSSLDRHDFDDVYFDLHGHYPWDDGITKGMVEEAMKMAAKDRETVSVHVSGKLEFYSKDPMSSRFPTSMQGGRHGGGSGWGVVGAWAAGIGVMGVIASMKNR